MDKLTGNLTNVQLELLRLFSFNANEKDLLEIKMLLGSYFAKKATSEMDKLWDEENWNNDTMQDWLNEHLRIKNEE